MLLTPASIHILYKGEGSMLCNAIFGGEQRCTAARAAKIEAKTPQVTNKGAQIKIWEELIIGG